MKVYKRGKVWWFKIQFEGTLYQRSTKHTAKVKAETTAAAFRVALANDTFGIIERKPAPAFGDAMTAFLSWSEDEHSQHPATSLRYRTSSKPLLAFSKFNKSIDQITPALIEEYKSRRGRQLGKRTKRHIKPATINRELACLKCMFNHALKERYDFRNPVSKVGFLPEDNEQTRVLTFEEQHQYLAVASETLEDVAGLMLETGMRPEEVYRITVENVALDQGSLFIPFGKTKAARRRIPLTSVALEILERRISTTKGTCIFPHRKDPNRPILKVNKAHWTALKNSGVKRFRLYDCRHTWATRAAEAGMDMITLAALLGHSNLNMVKRYCHPQERHQAEAMKKLEEINRAKQIAEFERVERVATKTATVGGNQPDLRVH